MDAVQKMICKALGRLESYQSVLNWEEWTPFSNIIEEHIQLMHNGAKLWLMPSISNDSLHTNLTPVTKNCLKALYNCCLLQLLIVSNCVCKGRIERIVSCRFLL